MNRPFPIGLRLCPRFYIRELERNLQNKDIWISLNINRNILIAYEAYKEEEMRGTVNQTGRSG